VWHIHGQKRKHLLFWQNVEGIGKKSGFDLHDLLKPSLLPALPYRTRQELTLVTKTLVLQYPLEQSKHRNRIPNPNTLKCPVCFCQSVKDKILANALAFVIHNQHSFW